MALKAYRSHRFEYPHEQMGLKGYMIGDLFDKRGEKPP